MNINDPELTKIIQSIQIPSTHFKKIKEPEQDQPCKHNLTNCLSCAYEALEVKPVTAHQIARAFYIKYSQPLRLFPYDEDTTEENNKLRQKELGVFGKRLVQSSKAGDFDTMLFISDSLDHNTPTDRDIRIMSYLFSTFYTFKDLTGQEPEPLTEGDTYELDRLRVHVFKCQVDHIKREAGIKSW